MRLRLQLHACTKEVLIPYNYQYYLATVLYRFVQNSSEEYAAKLHSGTHVNTNRSTKLFKYFCFSQLYPVKAHTTPQGIVLDDPRVYWYVSVSIEETIRHLVIGMFENQEFFIQRPEERFVVRNVELLPDPTFCEKMTFRVLSPVTASQPVNELGKLRARYLMPGDQELSEALRKNIIERYVALYDSEPIDTTFAVTPDWKYIEKRGGVHKVSKLITIKEHTRDETKVRGFVCPVTIEGNPALIKLAYESGLGEKGSMGFGMLEVASETTKRENHNIAETL